MADDRDEAMFKAFRPTLSRLARQTDGSSLEDAERPPPSNDELAIAEAYQAAMQAKQPKKRGRPAKLPVPPPRIARVIEPPPKIIEPKIVESKQIATVAPQEVSRFDEVRQSLEVATEPMEVRQIEIKLDAIEGVMRQSGLYQVEEIRPVNETKMRARWKLGRLLRVAKRGHAGRPGKNEFRGGTYLSMITDLGMVKSRALEAERIGDLPVEQLERAFADSKAAEPPILTTYGELVERARPYWYAAQRKERHQTIAAEAVALNTDDWGPFPLIYADPPWKFETYSDMGLERTADQHYPTLTIAEIIAFQVGKRTIPEIAHESAALFLWCTSSNIMRAMMVMHEWGFEYKTHAVWVKDRTAQGLVFRNKHEVLLYGIRGKMPGPQYQPDSVFVYPRGDHSAKPVEIRAEIERMYPDFDRRTRLELFARDTTPEWSSYGYEASNKP